MRVKRRLRRLWYTVVVNWYGAQRNERPGTKPARAVTRRNPPRRAGSHTVQTYRLAYEQGRGLCPGSSQSAYEASACRYAVSVSRAVLPQVNREA